MGDSVETKENMLHTSFFFPGICEGEIIQPIKETNVGQKVLLDSLKEKG